MTHGSRARPYSQSRWKALACPTLITITFVEEATPHPHPRPPSRAVGTPCTAGRDGNLIPPGDRRNLRESSKDGQDAINQSQEPDVQRRLHEPKLTQSRNTRTTDTRTPPPPPSHPHTEASGEATVHQTKATASQISGSHHQVLQHQYSEDQ